MTVIAFALVAAALYGTADFLGGAASRRTTAFAVVLVSTPAGLATMLLAALLVPGRPSAVALAVGALAGVIGGLGMVTFYAALAIGPMSVVAPVSALTSTLLPVIVALAMGERLSTPVLIGAGLCIAAIAMVGVERERPGERPRPGRAALLSFLAGAGFGLFMVLIVLVPGDSGMWSLAAARAGGLAVSILVALVAGARIARGRGTVALAVAAGVLDSLANAAYLLASRAGMLSVAAVITSLYPAVTVVLARLIYSERLRGVQLVGLALAVGGVVLVTS
ncbi:MAG: EamA family transporter [Streptosporangiales bacterium]|nr:EamA family transporter [Streptosporangiales bacterium]